MEVMVFKVLSMFLAVLTALSTFLGQNSNTVPENPEETVNEIYEETNIPTEPTTTQTFDKYNAIGDYHYGNCLVDGTDDEYTADMIVDLIGDTEENKHEFIRKFAEVYSFEPTAQIECIYIGKFIVEDFDEAQDVYRYKVKDSTYPLLTDEFFAIKRKICTDGSPWVGFAVPIDFYNEEFTQETYDLMPLMHKEFCDWTGYDMDYIYANKDKFFVDTVSVAGKMRTDDGKVEDVVYVYMRGVDMPVNASDTK